MILDRLSRYDSYRNLTPGMDEAFSFLKSQDLSQLALGKHEIRGEALYATVAEYTGKDPEQGVWEAHKKYIDVQYIVSGVERMGVIDVSTLEVTKPYDEQSDCMLLKGAGPLVTVPAGSFAIFFPHDAHMPNLAAVPATLVRKVVVKVRVA